MDYPIDMNKPWYHGSNLEFEILREGSTITQWKELAEAFATQPTSLSYSEIFSPISHNGTKKGILYIIDEPLQMDVDIYQHPKTTMDKGVEFITKRPLKLRRIDSMLNTMLISGKEIPVYSFDTLIIGSGCAALNAADSLYDFGCHNIAVVTEGINMGASRNTGSDKQTYYKLSVSSGEPDSVSAMAETLFSGGSVNGDTALTEAACSVRAFMKLVNLGVPFPTNSYGEFVGYQTDHDKRKRATSAGPLTSRYMTEALEASINKKGVKIIDNIIAFKLLTTNNNGEIAGAVGYDKASKDFVLFKCANIIQATGGHAQIYKNSVYPKSQTGMTGMALELGLRAANLQEWQYGMASVDFRWNLSGTYQQVIPKYISVDGNGTEREFLLDYFENPNDSVSYVFQKGYQWPFDTAKINGSTIIDLIVYNEEICKNRKVYLDFRTEPSILQNSGFEALSEEAFDYLKRSDALIETPIKRLEKMNPKAIELYKSNGIDLHTEPLRISVCAQHSNGGVAVDCHWETDVKGLYVAGEAAGTFGVYRPGGTALNSTQVGSLRAAEHIAENPANTNKRHISVESFENIVHEQAENLLKEIRGLAENPKADGRTLENIKKTASDFSEEMSRVGAQIRMTEGMSELYCKAKETLKNLPELAIGLNINKPDEITAYLKLRDQLITQIAVLHAMICAAENIGTRGGALVCDSEPHLTSAKEIFGLASERNNKFNDKILYTRYLKNEQDKQDKSDKTDKSESEFAQVREIPQCDNWFENVWNEYMQRKSGLNS